MGKIKELWTSLFSSKPILTGYQPESKTLIHYRGWCVEAGRHFHAHVEVSKKHALGECPFCAKMYLVPNGLRKMITEEHHLELSNEVMKPPRKP